MARPGNPAFVKGAPSANPHGRGAPFARAEIAKAAARAPGSAGIIAYNGIVQTGERSGALTGKQKWIEYANLPIRSAPVAIAYLLRTALFGGVKWTLTENAAGGKAARKGLEVCQQGLLDARLPLSWRDVATKALNGAYFSGFSLHSFGISRRKDGLVTYSDDKHLPQHTIAKWFRKTAQDPFTEIEQQIDDGTTFPVKLSDCLYLKNNMLGDGPEGVGVLRLLIDRIRLTQRYRKLEGSELFSSMGGTPIARAPLEEIAAGATGKTEDEMRAYIDNATQAIEEAVANRIKSPDEQLYLKLDSKTYEGTNPNSITNVQKWGIEIVKGELQGAEAIRKIITDEDLNDARILGVAWVFIGGGDTKGTFSAHESGVSLFGAQLSADLDRAGEQGTLQVCRPLVAANGLDPDEACPTLVASPIATDDVEATARALGLLNMAGLEPNHPAKKVLFERMNLPWQDEAEPVLPRMGAPFGQPKPDDGTGDPNQGNPSNAPDRVDPASEDPTGGKP